MKGLLLGISCFLLASSAVSAQQKFPDSSEIVFNRAMREINTKYVTWIRSTALQVNEKNLGESDVKKMATRQWAVLGNIQDADIEALCFLVLMQAAKSAQEDLKAIMSTVKAINEKKKALRDAVALLNKKDTTVIMRNQYDSLQSLLGTNPNTRVSKTKLVKKAELNRLVSDLMNKIDALNKQEEEEQLRLQMAMDRMSKMMTTLSNLLKKISETAQSITQNLK